MVADLFEFTLAPDDIQNVSRTPWALSKLPWPCPG
jgi:hypothetical protein